MFSRNNVAAKNGVSLYSPACLSLFSIRAFGVGIVIAAAHLTRNVINEIKLDCGVPFPLLIYVNFKQLRTRSCFSAKVCRVVIIAATAAARVEGCCMGQRIYRYIYTYAGGWPRERKPQRAKRSILYLNWSIYVRAASERKRRSECRETD